MATDKSREYERNESQIFLGTQTWIMLPPLI